MRFDLLKALEGTEAGELISKLETLGDKGDHLAAGAFDDLMEKLSAHERSICDLLDRIEKVVGVGR